MEDEEESNDEAKYTCETVSCSDEEGSLVRNILSGEHGRDQLISSVNYHLASH